MAAVVELGQDLDQGAAGGRVGLAREAAGEVSGRIRERTSQSRSSTRRSGTSAARST